MILCRACYSPNFCGGGTSCQERALIKIVQVNDKCDLSLSFYRFIGLTVYQFMCLRVCVCVWGKPIIGRTTYVGHVLGNTLHKHSRQESTKSGANEPTHHQIVRIVIVEELANGCIEYRPGQSHAAAHKDKWSCSKWEIRLSRVSRGVSRSTNGLGLTRGHWLKLQAITPHLAQPG